MRKGIKWLLVIVVSIVLLLPSFSSAADYNGYSITNYDIDIRVNENKTYDVALDLTANFSVPSRGIFLRIPVRFEAQRQDQPNTMVNAVVSDISVNEDYETERDGDYLVLRIGDEDVYLTGPVDYQISYTYDPGDDGLADVDEFYYEIVGTGWDTSIEGVDFKIDMPKPFEGQPGFSVGAAGATGYVPDTLTYDVSGNTISGSFAGTLNPYEGIAIRLELPQGYFVGVRQPQDMLMPFVIIVGIMAAAMVVLAVLFGKKQNALQTVEFYPPEGMTSADIGYIVDGTADDKDLISLLMYWAEKGYITISELDKNEMAFTRLQDLPDHANDYEKLMFNRMFVDGPETSTKKLQYKFYDTLATAKGRLKSKFESADKRVFLKRSLILRDVCKMLSAVPLAAMAMFSAYQYSFDAILAFVAAVFVFAFSYAISSKYVSAIGTWQSEKRASKTGSIILWAVLSAILYALLGWLCYAYFGMMVFFGIGCSLLLTLLAPLFRKRTEQGLKWYGRILGLKNFIISVEAEKLKMMVNEDPQYFYHVLPYAYVLGISDKWASRFEGIAVAPPSWYYGSSMSTFSTIYFTSVITSSMLRAQTMVAMRPSSGGGSGGGNFGGGGFSGGGFSGGFGGGGGGRW